MMLLVILRINVNSCCQENSTSLKQLIFTKHGRALIKHGRARIEHGRALQKKKSFHEAKEAQFKPKKSPKFKTNSTKLVILLGIRLA